MSFLFAMATLSWVTAAIRLVTLLETYGADDVCAFCSLVTPFLPLLALAFEPLWMRTFLGFMFLTTVAVVWAYAGVVAYLLTVVTRLRGLQLASVRVFLQPFFGRRHVHDLVLVLLLRADIVDNLVSQYHVKELPNPWCAVGIIFKHLVLFLSIGICEYLFKSFAMA